ncbi:carboxypeptidase-like regulatory domain-containing protein [Flavobacterium sp. UMI-01]|uniref:carboxypeptidase-like regulatory domain-containing protein n=1 Tax=Flavobacterium sp. UMI-01 TaxID=1441053 RepID=UPI001C7DED57|nr:carboxypeptidase-like regulatory domain-containing protein [Flavobacterium sp. UMI-01]GIZ08963.1 hypothetical protein FUMI01_16900 [Flavobacterium sp. UMI-01]
MCKEVFIWVFFFIQINYGQNRNDKVVHGKIIANQNATEGITVTNLSNKTSTLTNNNGEFHIEVKKGDSLIFSSIALEKQTKLIELEDLNDAVMIIEMQDKVNNLETVVINKQPEINALSTGVLSKKPKSFTQMERKLETAGDFKPIHLLGLLGGCLAIDPLLNAINGRTKSIKRMFQVEKKSEVLNQITPLFDEDYFTKRLKIPKDYIKGFLYYWIEDKNNETVLKSKNKIQIDFLMTKLALEYNQLIQGKTKL